MIKLKSYNQKIKILKKKLIDIFYQQLYTFVESLFFLIFLIFPIFIYLLIKITN
jgi:hypothetical protein